MEKAERVYSNNSEKDLSKVDSEKSHNADYEKVKAVNTNSSEDSAPEVQKSFGVRKAELIVKQCDTKWLKAIYFFSIFIAMYVNTMEGQVTGVFVGYATNSYKKHSLMSTMGIVKRVIAAAALPCYARLSDIFGRLELFCVSIVFRIVGLIIQSQAKDIQRYAGGTVLYALGSSGSRFLWQVNLSDASSLRYRLLAIAILNLPAIITTWSSGNVVQSLLNNRSWQFGIAMWAFVFPLTCLPYFFCSFYMQRKASKTEEWKIVCKEEKESWVRMNRATKKHEEQMANGGSKVWGRIKIFFIRCVYMTREIFWRVDIVGAFFIVCFLALILVPLTLAGGVQKKWSKASTIVPLVVGFVMIPVFVIWESKIARNPLIAFNLLKDRGVWAAFVIAILYTFVSNMPNSYAYPVLFVGMNASKVVATRTPLLLHFVCALTLPCLGFVLSKVRRTKGFILFGIAVWFIAMGLFVHFRGDNDGLRGKYFRDGVAVGMCLLGFGQGFFNRLVVVSIQACTNHEYMAAVTAMFNAIYQIGGAFGKCVSGAIWTQTMYFVIKKHMGQLGVDELLAKSAYEAPYTFIKKYKWGSTPRIAVVLAYAEVQKKLCIVGLCLCVPLLFFALFLRDNRLADVQSLEDEEDPEHGNNKGGKMIFRDDNDPIFDAVKQLIPFKRSSNTH